MEVITAVVIGITALAILRIVRNRRIESARS